jgi:hypothetical protein
MTPLFRHPRQESAGINPKKPKIAEPVHSTYTLMIFMKNLALTE